MSAKPIDVQLLIKKFRLRGESLERKITHTGRHKLKKPFWKIVHNVKNHHNGYCNIGINGKGYHYARIKWVLYFRKDMPPETEIDHIDGNKINNNIKNLRAVSKQENQSNRKCHRAGASIGACFCKHSKKWVSDIVINRTPIRLGYYNLRIDAHNIYIIAKNNAALYTNNASFRKMVNDKYSATINQKLRLAPSP